MTNSTSRRVTANMSLTLDGRYNGPGGPGDLGAIVPYATTEVARNHLTRIWETATTALLGRLNAEGFMGFWPSVAGDENADRVIAHTRSGWSTQRRSSSRLP